MNVEKLSTSRVSQYLSCPKEYHFDRFSDKEPLKIRDDEALHKGSIIHKILEKLRFEPKKDLVSDFVHEVAEGYEEYILSDKEAQKIIDMLKNWVETRDLGYEVIDVEKYFKIPIKDFYLTGKIDVVERLNSDELRITDYKTGKTYKDIQDMKDNTQLKFYTLAAMETYGIDNVEVSLDQTRFEPPEYIQYRREDLVDFLQYILSIKRRMENDETFDPKPGWHCSWCDYYHHCPVMSQGLEELEVEGFSLDEMGKKYNEIHGRIKVLKDKKKKLKEMIMGKMNKEETESFNSDEVKVNKVQSRYTHYDPKTVMENVPEDELDKVLKVKKSKVDNLDLDKETRQKIEEEANHSYSSPYIRVSNKED